MSTCLHSVAKWQRMASTLCVGGLLPNAYVHIEIVVFNLLGGIVCECVCVISTSSARYIVYHYSEYIQLVEQANAVPSTQTAHKSVSIK